MNERIRKFMDAQGLSPSELADNIGVQRSNVSHVLNGRNNPSFPFIEKLLKKYPKLNAKWLLTGEGTMMEGKPVLSASLFDIPGERTENGSEISTSSLYTEKEEEKFSDVVQEPVNKSEEKKENHIDLHAIITSNTQEKTIKKVIVLYDDKTFEAYNPSN